MKSSQPIRTASTSTVVAVAMMGALLLGGCNGALIGNVVVLGVTIGIFFGTLGLGRAKRSEASRSSEATTASSEMSSPGA